MKCQCKDGHFPSAGGRCVVNRHCSSPEFNSAMEPTQGECGPNQFCRNNVCLCNPNHEFDELGNCLPNEPLIDLDQKTKSKNQNLQDLVTRNELKIVQNKMDTLSTQLITTQLIMFILLVGYAFGIGWLILGYYPNKQKPQQTESIELQNLVPQMPQENQFQRNLLYQEREVNNV